MKVLAAPAIDIARNGIPVDGFQYHDFCLLEPILAVSKPHPVFWDGDVLRKEGETMSNPELGDCLDHLVREGVQDFYIGDVSKMILKLNDQLGGHLTAEDMAAYAVHEYEPLVFPYRDRTILTNPLPSLGGGIIALALARLEAMGPVDYAPMSVQHVERLMKVFSGLDAIPKTSAAIAAELRKLYPNIPTSSQKSVKLGGTSHISILDEHGNGVAVSTSNGEGCGHFVPETGVIMNNMLGEMALLPNGIHSWEENVRLGSMMSPTIVLDAQQHAEIVLGSGGAGRIPFMLSQAIHNMVDHGMDLHSAIHSPRLHWHEGICNMEPGLPTDVNGPASMKELVSWEKQSLYFGGVHAVRHLGKEIEAHGDDRRGGVMLRVD